MSKRSPLTHFLCIPLVTSASKIQLEKALSSFTDRVAGDSLDSDQAATKIPNKAIRPIWTIHLTLGVMSLDAEKLEAAKSFLRNTTMSPLITQGVGFKGVERSSETSITESEIHPENLAEQPKASQHSVPDPALPPIIVSLRGIQPMHSPTSTSILYAQPTDFSARLFPFCESLRQAFTNAGFLVPESRPLKLHATIVNTIYVKGRNQRRRGGGHGKDKKAGLKIDATELIEDLKDFVWMENVRLDRVSICEMGAKKIERDGEAVEEYLEVESVALP